MKPTAKLRFVKRSESFVVEGLGREVIKTVHILQQWWCFDEDESIGEWCDVPVEVEE